MRTRSGSWPWALWILIGAAFAVRAAAWIATGEIRCLADECFYTKLAGALASGKGFQPHAGHYWPPGQIAFLAAHIKMGVGTYGAKATHVLLSTLLVPLAFAAGRRAAATWGDDAARRTGLVAAALIAFNPTLVAYSHYLWSETLFLPLFLGAVLLGLDAGTSGSTRQAAAAGALFGIACLVKVLPLYFVPVLAAWIGWHAPWERRPARLALTLVGAMLLVIAPWALRNTITHGRFVLIETTTGKNLVRGNNPVGPANWDWGAVRRPQGALIATGCRETDDPVALNACFTARGVDAILDHPARFLRQGATKLADLVNPTSFLVRHIRRGIYGNWPPAVADAVVIAVAAINILLMGLGAAGWINGPPSSLRTIVLLFTLYTIAVHVVMFAMSRFRLPLEPFLAVGTALVLAGGSRIAVRLRQVRYLWLTAAVLLALGIGWMARVSWLFAPPRPGQSLGPAASSLAEPSRPTARAAPPIMTRLSARSRRVGPGTTPASRPAGELSQRSRRQTRFSSATIRDSAATTTARPPLPAGTACSLPSRCTATTRPTTWASATTPRSRCRIASPLVT